MDGDERKFKDGSSVKFHIEEDWETKERTLCIDDVVVKDEARFIKMARRWLRSGKGCYCDILAEVTSETADLYFALKFEPVPEQISVFYPMPFSYQG